MNENILDGILVQKGDNVYNYDGEILIKSVDDEHGIVFLKIGNTIIKKKFSFDKADKSNSIITTKIDKNDIWIGVKDGDKITIQLFDVYYMIKMVDNNRESINMEYYYDGKIKSFFRSHRKCDTEEMYEWSINPPIDSQIQLAKDIEQRLKGYLPKIYIPKGKIIKHEFYIEEARDGEFKVWHDIYGQPEIDHIKSIEYYDMDTKINGPEGEPWTYYTMYGILSATFYFENGLKSGIFKSWYDNGSIFKIKNFKNGLKDGLYEEWHMLHNGVGGIAKRGNYIKGLKHGLFEFWNEYGEKIGEKYYNNGII